MPQRERTLDQKRAAHALGKVRDVKKDTDAAGNYRSYVEAVPATIVMNGLGQTCATLLSRAAGDSHRNRAYRLLFEHLQEWLCQRDGAVYRGDPSLIDAIVQGGQRTYVHAQAEALAYLVWLKKFGQAYLPKGARDDG